MLTPVMMMGQGVMGPLTASSFTASTGDGGTVVWTVGSVALTTPNNNKSVFTKCHYTKNTGIVFAQCKLTWSSDSTNENLGGLHISSVDYTTPIFGYAENYTAMIGSRNSAGGKFRIRVNTTTNVYDSDNGLPAKNTDIKITFNTSTNEIKFWYWTGSVWSQMGTTQTYDIKNGGNLKMYILDNNLNITNETYTFSDIYYGTVQADYSTHYPL